MTPSYCTITIDGLLKEEKLKLAKTFLGDKFGTTIFKDYSDWSFQKSLKLGYEKVLAIIRVRLENLLLEPRYFGNCVIFVIDPSYRDSIGYAQKILTKLDLSKYFIIILEIEDLKNQQMPKVERNRWLDPLKSFKYFKCKLSNQAQVNKIFKTIIKEVLIIKNEGDSTKFESPRERKVQKLKKQYLKPPYESFPDHRISERRSVIKKVIHKIEDLKVRIEKQKLEEHQKNYITIRNKQKKIYFDDVLDLGGRKLESLDDINGLQNLKFLKVLNLGGNRLRNLKGIHFLKNLRQLNLSGNQLTEIKGLGDLTHLEVLDLSINQITHIEGLEKLIYLRELKIPLTRTISNIIKDLDLDYHKGYHNYIEVLEPIKLIEAIRIYKELKEDIYIEEPYIISIEKIKSLSKKMGKDQFLIFLKEDQNKFRFQDLNDFVSFIEFLTNFLSFEQMIKSLNNINFDEMKRLVEFSIRENKIDSFERLPYNFDILIKLIGTLLGKEKLLHYLAGIENLRTLLEKSYYEERNFPSNPTLIIIERILTDTLKKESSFQEEIKSIIERCGFYFKHLLRELDETFRINEYITLKLVGTRTNIYIEDQLFQQCKYLLLNIPIEKVDSLHQIESIDEAAEILDRSLEGRNQINEITPVVEFWGHCSNIQAWVENNYDTRLLHSNLAFPLLRKLTYVGDPLARKVFKDQIVDRILSGYLPVLEYLSNEGYMDWLNSKDILTIVSEALFTNKIELLKFLLRNSFLNSLEPQIMEQIRERITHSTQNLK